MFMEEIRRYSVITELDEMVLARTDIERGLLSTGRCAILISKQIDDSEFGKGYFV